MEAQMKAEVREVTFFIGNPDGRGLTKRSKTHYINVEDPTRTKCGLDYSWHDGVKRMPPMPFTQSIRYDNVCSKCRKAHEAGR
jgi:hypothetical protein